MQRSSCTRATKTDTFLASANHALSNWPLGVVRETVYREVSCLKKGDGKIMGSKPLTSWFED